MVENSEILGALKILSDALGVNLSDLSIAISTEEKSAKVRAANNSLEATLISAFNVMNVESPRAPGIEIKLVDRNKDEPLSVLAPPGAVYRIEAYRHLESGGRESLSGDVNVIYIGYNGIILNENSKRHIAEEYQNKE